MALDGALTEGLTSNFFVVSAAGEVVTANEGALNGTVRQVVLQVCILCRCFVVTSGRRLLVFVLAHVRVRCCTACTSLLGIGQSWMAPDGALTEGLTSNFFVVSAAGEVVTANEGALNGTVREVVLQVQHLM
jgi:branched-subunit amino acid aminotransferase/4-amino-4-deoxychorismate lyase